MWKCVLGLLHCQTHKYDFLVFSLETDLESESRRNFVFVVFASRESINITSGTKKFMKTHDYSKNYYIQIFSVRTSHIYGLDNFVRPTNRKKPAHSALVKNESLYDKW